MELRCCLVLLLVCSLSFLSLSWSANPHDADLDDNEFAEFEDFDDGTSLMKLLLLFS